MKKTFTFLLMALLALAGFKSWGQTEIQIGDGQYTQSVTPFYNYYNYSYAQMLYLGSEIGESGTITSISFHNSRTSSLSNMKFNIYMKCVSKDSYSGNSDWVVVTGEDLVYSATLNTVNSGWATFTLDTPFEYDNTQGNLMIAFDNNTGGCTGSSGYAQFYYTSTIPTHTCIYYYNDYTHINPTNPTPQASGTTYQRPDIKITIESSASCPKPKDLAASNVTATGATISWTDNDAESYDLAYGVASTFDLENPSTYILQSGLTTTSVTLSGLTAETEYKCAVKAHCSGDDESAWSSVIAFMPSVFQHLTVNDGTDTYDKVPFYGDMAYYNLTKSQFVIPASYIEDMQGCEITQLKFYVNSSSSYLPDYSSDRWNVYITEKDDPSGAWWDFSDFGTMTNVYSGSVSIMNNELTVTLDEPFQYNNKSLMIGFNQTNTGFYGVTHWLGSNNTTGSAGTNRCRAQWSNSDKETKPFLPKTTFTYTSGATCPKPKDLAVSNITATGATISWTGSAESYDLAYGVASTFDLSNSTTYTLQSGLTTTSVQLSGLIAETEYKCAVKAHCSDEEESAWSDAISFLPTATKVLTVCDGNNTNAMIPIYGGYADSDYKSQFIFPAQYLESMQGGIIKSMTFYAQQANVNIPGTWSVYLSEVDGTTLSGLKDWDDLENVVEGQTMTISGNKLTINFPTPFEYNGGNLLIGFNETESGSFTDTYWYGVSQSTNTAYYRYFYHSESTGSIQFLPKTTFAYEDGAEKFAITLTQPEDAAVGTISADYEQAAAGTTVTLSADFNLGYTLDYFMVDEEPIVGNTFEMPEHDVTVSVAYNTLDMYAITFDPEIDDDIISVSATYNSEPVTAAPAGTEITLSYSNLDEGYTFNYWTLNGAQLTGSTFEMPEEDAVIGVNLTERTRYAVAIDSDVQDYITADPSSDILGGTTVTLTISPATGYVLAELHVLDEDENEQAVTINPENSNIRTFVMPESNVTVSAVFSPVYNISIDMALVGGSISQRSTQGTLTAYPAGTQVFLFANPDEDYSFVENSFIVIRSDGEIGPTVTYTNMMYSFIMPESSVTVSATFNKTAFAVSQVITPTYSGSFSVSKTAHVGIGETVTLSNFNAYESYYFDFEDVNSLVVKRNDNHETVEVNNYGNIYQFAMPASDVTVTATFKELPRYSVFVGDVVNGTIYLDNPYQDILAGDIIYFEVEPEIGYTLESITVTPEEGNPFEPTQQAWYYYFTMPSSNVTISATFRQLQSYTINYYVNGQLDRTMQCREDYFVNNDGPQNVAVPAGMTFEGWGVAEIDPYTTEKPAVLGNAETPTQGYDLYAVLSYTESVPAGSKDDKWVKVTDANDLQAGDEIVLVYGNYVMGELWGTDYHRYEVSIANNEISNLPEKANVLTLVSSGSNWKLQYYESEISSTTTLSYNYTSNCLAYYGYGNSWGYISYDEWTAIESSGVMFYNNNKYIGNYPDGDWITVVNSTNTACKAYKKDNPMVTTNYYMTSVLADGDVTANTTAKNIIITTGIVTVDNNIVLTMNENGLFRNENAANFVFEDGAQLIYTGEETVNATFEKDIIGYNSKGSDGWYFIANPTDNTTVNLSGGNSYDLYTFNPAAAAEWQNEQYENNVPIPENEIAISRETGYLYANSADFTLRFEGELIPSGEETINLTYAEEGTGIDFPGFNLVGNPFPCTAYISSDFDLYKLVNGSEVQISEDFTMDPCEAFFVEATVDNQEVTISTTAPEGKSRIMPIVVNSDRGETLDRAILHLEGTRNSHKFMMNPDRTNISFAKNGERFAAVSRGDETEIPMNFTADHKGSYTISFNTENFEEEYLHLIDVVSGDNIDLLVTPSYTFEADADEYASRFRIVFGTTDINDDPATSSEPFVYISNGNLVINNVEGTASMQIVDMLGRIVRTETINGSYNKPHNLKAGAYVITLDGKAQRIVIE